MTRRIILSTLITFTAAMITPDQVRPMSAAAQDRDQKTFHLTVPFGFTVGTCDGEAITVVGEEKITIHTSEDNSGGIHSSGHFVARGTGVGLSSGDEYLIRDVFQSSVNAGLGPFGCPFTSAETAHVNIINQEPGAEGSNSTLVVLTTHLSYNESCEPTAEFVSFEVRCSGRDTRP